VFVIFQRLASRGLRDGIYVVWDRDILEFFLTGLMLFSLGIIGEYVGRIYQQVRHRPRYVVQTILETEEQKQDLSRHGAAAAGASHFVRPSS